MKPDPESKALEYRAKQLCAARGPSNTFKCGKCGGHKQILGRKLIAKVWCCGACATYLKGQP